MGGMMQPAARLAALTRLNDTLATYLRAHDHHMPRPLPHGMKDLGAPRDELRDHPDLARMALARFLVWQSFLRHQRPTPSTLLRLQGRFRGYALWRIELRKPEIHFITRSNLIL